MLSRFESLDGRAPGLLSVLMVFLLSGCGNGDDPQGPSEPRVGAVTVRTEVSQLTALGQTTRATAEVRDQSGAPMPAVTVVWSSTRTDVATVDGAGLITAVGPGQASIRAEASGVSGEAPISVVQIVTSLVAQSASLHFTALQDTARVTVQAIDANARPVSGARLVWTSSAPSVAAVDTTGLVRAAGPGQAVVRAETNGLRAEILVRVEQVPIRLSVVTAPGQASAGQAFAVQPVIEVHDANGFRVAQDAPRVVQAGLVPPSGPGGATLAGATSQSTQDGVARFTSLRLDGTVGSYEIEFVAEGLLAARSGSFALGAGSATALVVLQGENAEVIVGGDVDPASVRVADAFGNPVPERIVNWEVLEGGGSLNPAVSTSDANGVAATVWTTGPQAGTRNRIRATLAGVGASVLVSTVPVSPEVPFRFLSDTDWVAPGRLARIIVRDARGRTIPPNQISYRVQEYSCCGVSGGITVDPFGTASLATLSGVRVWAYRILASRGAVPVEDLVMIVAHDWDAPRTVEATEHWRFVLPSSWTERMDATVPDWRGAVDIGWEAQKELMGLTAEEAHNAAHPMSPVLPQAIGVEDPAVCGVSSIPLSFGQDCFVFPSGPNVDQPRWFIIFHEMGHATTIAQQARAVFCQLYCAPGGGATWVEGDASLFSLWSSYRMMNDPSLSGAARASVRSTFEQDTALFSRQLGEWEASSAAFSDGNDFAGFHAGPWDGIHVRTIQEFGWDWVLRYARAFRNDPQICTLMRGASNCFGPGNTTLIQRATFAAAAVSAAVRQDLKARFLDWRFPIDDSLYAALYTRLSEAMNSGW